AHLDDEARFGGVPELTPTLVRWDPQPGGPPHLAIGLDRLAQTRRGESLLVVAETPSTPLLERVADVRRKGASIFALDGGDRDLEGLAHEVLTVNEDPVVSFEGAQHLVSLAAGEATVAGRRSPGLRARLARLLDSMAGEAPGRTA
ncbi:MAG TPA: hypothetical protein VI076_12230, partial [Actinopolymorphaceae bacterium]